MSLKCHSRCFSSQTCLSVRACSAHLKEQPDFSSAARLSALFPQIAKSPARSFRSDFFESSSNQIDVKVDNGQTLVIFNSEEQKTFEFVRSSFIPYRNTRIGMHMFIFSKLQIFFVSFPCQRLCFSSAIYFQFTITPLALCMTAI